MIDKYSMDYTYVAGNSGYKTTTLLRAITYGKKDANNACKRSDDFENSKTYSCIYDVDGNMTAKREYNYTGGSLPPTLLSSQPTH